MRLNSLCCELTVLHIVRARGVFSQMPPLQPEHTVFQVPFSFIFLRKMGTILAASSFGQKCSSDLAAELILKYKINWGFLASLRGTGRNIVTGPCRQTGLFVKGKEQPR